MRRYAAALALAAMALATAAGSPDLIRVPTDTAAPPSADTAATVLGPCGLDYSGRASGYTLTPHDVWPTATKTGQALANYTIDPAAFARPVGDPESGTGAMRSRRSVLSGRRAGDGTGRVVVTGMHALTFAGHNRLSESRKIALLYQAATLADR